MIKHRAFFGDAEHDFALTGDQIVELERTTGAGIGTLCQRVFAGAFNHQDIVETIRLALIGGDTDPQEAASLTKAYLPSMPIAASMALAVDILSVLYFGPPETPKADDGEAA